MTGSLSHHHAGEAVLLRRAERLAGEARQCRDLAGPNALLLALMLRQQLVAIIEELAAGCAAMTGQRAASQLRQTATAAYRANASIGRIRP